MNANLNSERRSFLVRSAALTGGLMLGVRFPGEALAAASASGAPEVTHWVVIQPDDTVIVRIARSELGQGTFTGLAQLVAEELEADWSKVKAEYADVNDHIRRNRIFGSMSTGGSRGIRDSNKYMREAGAEGIEMVMWLVMRGALNDNVKEVRRFYTVPASNTAVGHIILDNRV
jgi:isoquinoline 1-oxidoreductase beta subunit